MTTTMCGTEDYMAPEVFQMKEYDHKADIWGIGCIIMFMMFG